MIRCEGGCVHDAMELASLHTEDRDRTHLTSVEFGAQREDMAVDHECIT
jgi:hypothetical protein